MNTISMELHEEQITELQSQIEELESEKHCLEEELEDLKVECEDLEDRCESYKEASQNVLSNYNEDLETTKALQELNSKLVKNCKKANRDFFILAAAYVATLMLMIYLFIRQENVMVSFYRTCRYENKNYLFHCFEQWSNVIGESIAIGGHSAGQISQVFALIEDKKGNIFRVDPTAIVFTDDKYLDYFCDLDEE